MNITPVDLIDHSSWLGAEQTVEQAHFRFARHSYDFMAVLNSQGQVEGLCSRGDLSSLLGSQYGFSLFARASVMDHLRHDPICIEADKDMKADFAKVFARDTEDFYEDVLVLGPSGKFLGLIHTHPRQAAESATTGHYSAVGGGQRRQE